jgi:hypothetical protein
MIYLASAVAATMPNGGVITRITFRLDGPSGTSVSTDLADFEIRMGTAMVPALQSSATYAANVGSDYTTVFPRGSIHWESPASKPGPNPFVLTIPLGQTFTYNPAAGDLVVDLLNYARVPGIVLDGSSAGLSWVGPVENTQAFAPPQGAAALQLTFIPTPEPVPELVGMVALIISGLSRGRRR